MSKVTPMKCLLQCCNIKETLQHKLLFTYVRKGLPMTAASQKKSCSVSSKHFLSFSFLTVRKISACLFLEQPFEKLFSLSNRFLKLRVRSYKALFTQIFFNSFFCTNLPGVSGSLSKQGV